MATVTVYCTAVVEFLNYHQWRSFYLVLLAAFACFFTLVAWAYIYRHSLFGEMTALLGIKPKVVGSKLSKKSSKKEAMTKDSTAPPPSESICGGEDLKVNNKIPSKSDLEKCADLPILDVNKKSLPFKSLYSSQKGGRRVLVIFIRHFFCGLCQEYLRALCEAVTPESLLALSTPIEIAVIGCGNPDLIPMYTETTNCPFPIYSDPTKALYKRLNMVRTLDLGPTAPEYLSQSFFLLAVKSTIQSIMSGRKMLSGGDYSQVGGEFLFEDGKVTWCHRMRNTRDHAEIPEIRKQLGVDGETPRQPRKRWSTHLTTLNIRRSLSNKRQSWSRSRSRTSREHSQDGSIANRNSMVMEGVKEERYAGSEETAVVQEPETAMEPTIKVVHAEA
ncbi:MAG: hypothetical protein MMC33_001615 [Icmadophila ericetorum]|nr:hypothetical protein [Icmadophila ericetorum]